MTQHAICNGRTEGTFISSGVTNYLGIGGYGSGWATEDEVEFLAQTAFSFSSLYIHLQTNSIGNSSTFRFRDNGANGNQSVTIPASTAGEFEDTTNSDSVGVGETCDYQIVTGAGGGGISLVSCRSLVDDADGNIHPYFADSILRTATGLGTTVYFALGGGDNGGDEVDEDENQYRRQTSLTLSDAFCYVSANGNSSNSTMGIRDNAANGNISMTVAASTTGRFTDTTNNDVIGANEFVNWYFTTGMGSHTDTNTTMAAWGAHGDSATRSMIAKGEVSGMSAGFTLRSAFEGDIVWDPTAAGTIDTDIGIAYTAENLFVFLDSNSFNGVGTIDTEISGSVGNVGVSVPASTPGIFEDTTNNDSISATDTVLYVGTLPAGSGSFVPDMMGLELTGPVVAAGTNYDMRRYPRGFMRGVMRGAIG